MAVMTFRRLVKPEDMNPADRLFGGRIMEWADEATALYAMCQMKTKSIVTLKVSEILFKNPAHSGDILEFYCTNKKVGNTSLTVGLEVKTKYIGTASVPALQPAPVVILECEFVFVAIDAQGKPVSWSKL
jgi:acyl-CoA hydrolase